MARTFKGRIILPTLSACALWSGEVTGQLSDGTWENSRPYGHYKFWFTVEPVQGACALLGPRVEMNEGNHAPWRQRTAYNIVSLMNLKWDCPTSKWAKEDNREGDDRYILRGRMLNMGRMAKALGRTDFNRGSAEYMPATMAEFTQLRVTGAYEHAFIKAYVDRVSDEDALKYYACEYTPKELRSDLLAIKAAMKTAIR
jgi:hypothetical protein